MRLLDSYAQLGANGDHLLGELLDGRAPGQSRHYPEDDAIDHHSGYQWFYHSHSPDDRPGTAEHGHFHVFARRPLWARRLHSAAEREFARMAGNPGRPAHTRHLLGIGIDAKGIPINLFTVNSWVTGDWMLSAANTEKLLERMHLATGHSLIDAVLESVITLCRGEIRDLLAARDAALRNFAGADPLANRSLEMLSAVELDLDRRLVELGASTTTP